MCALVTGVQTCALPILVRLIEGEAVALDQPYHAGLVDLGGRIDDAADRPLRPDRLPLRVAGIDGRPPGALERSADTVAVPPGHAVEIGRTSCRERVCHCV